VFFAPTDAFASKEPIPQMSLRPERGEIVELDYAPDGETMVGAFVIRNISSTPLTVSGARFVHSEAIPRIPPFVTVELEGSKGQPVVIEPGKEQRAIIRWQYGASRAREFYGLAYAEPSDTRVEGLVPVHGARPRNLGPLGDRALSVIVWFPILASILALVLRVLRRDMPRLLAASSTLVFAVQLAFVAAIGLRFDKAFARQDGNDGYQLVERFVITPPGGTEYFLGVDGISLTLVITVCIAALLASIASFSLRDRATAFHVIAPIFVSSVLGVFFSLDLLLFCAFWFVGVIAVTLLIASRGTLGARRAAIQLGAVSFAGMFFIVAAANWLCTRSDGAYLVDGRSMLHSLAIPDLAHVNWASIDTTLFGAKDITVVWSALFVAFVLRLVTWGNVFAESDAPTNMLVPAALIGTGIHGLLRLNLGVMPQGTQWAATTIIVVGLIMVIVCAFWAHFQTNMKRWIAYGATGYAGFALIGLGSRTPQGIASTMHIAVSLALAIGLFAMLAQTLETRVQSVDMTRLRGLSEDMPMFAWFFLAAGFVLLGLPGLAGFWGPLLAVVGVLPRNVPLALGAIASTVVLAALHIRFAGQILFGAVDSKWRKSKELAASAGKFPDLTRNELVVLVPLVVTAVGLGFSPRMLFSLLDAVLLDLHRLVDAAGAMQVG
jgi:NADH-quinone oxidoreductase subunit M